MKKSISLPAVLIISALLSACGGDSPEKLLANAKSHLEKNDSASAIIELKNVLSKEPNSAQARLMLGRALLKSGDAVAAEVELRKAIELKLPAGDVSPILVQALLGQGNFKAVIDEATKNPATSDEGKAELKTAVGSAYAALGNLDGAKTAFTEAIASQKTHYPAKLGLARLRAIAQDIPGSAAIVDEIIAADPKNVAALQFRGDLYRAEKKDAEALAAYRKVVEIDPKLVTAHGAIIMNLLRDQKADAAAEQLAVMQKNAAKHPLTLYMQGLVAYTKKDLPTARTAMEALIKAQPNNPQGLQLAGLIAFQSRADLQAKEFLSKALQRAPGLDMARRALILSQLRSGEPAKALATLQPVFKDGETTPSWLAIAGDVYLQNGDVKRAEGLYSQAAKSDPNNRQAQTALALARMQMGRVDEAFADLEQIASADTGVSADMALATTSLRQRQFDKALKAVAALEKKQPDSAVPHNLRATALLGKGDVAGARASFEKALAIDAAFLPAAGALAQLDIADKKPEQARKRFEGVIAKDPKNVQALLALAELRAREKADPNEIVDLVKKAITAGPAEPTPRAALVGLHLKNKDNAKALTAIQEAMAAMPDRPEILDLAGKVYQFTGDLQQALSTYGKLATLLPTAAHPYLRMAEIQIALKSKDGARDSLKKGLALLPSSVPLQRAMVMLDVDAGKFDDALAHARSLQKSRPKEIAGFGMEGDVHFARKSWKDAANAYRAGLKIAPTTELAERLYAALTFDNQAGEAAKFADGWIKSQPKDGKFRLFLADAANQRKDFATAAGHYRALLAVAPENAGLINNLAWSLGQMKDPKALELAEKANRLAPNQPAIMDTLGTILVESGKVDQGVEMLAAAVAAAPDAAEVRMNFAKALIKAGKKPAAKAELETLSKLGDKYRNQAEVAALLKAL